MPWRRGEYNVQLSEQRSQTSGDEISQTSSNKVGLSSYIITLDHLASASNQSAGQKHTALGNPQESTNRSAIYPPRCSTSWGEAVNEERTEVNELGRYTDL
ncbi:hypothetical protein [Wolbachia endosymbiont of Folsomia candida]|uniref:hypothetical protein n=1 Tax=Wolbachia endosymbiont of Folsomia candida TaxID=169402 RepID=UPI001300171D|nr:hypothetical protein [Wolbachia endosymbiont of Folsomia candida]